MNTAAIRRRSRLSQAMAAQTAVAMPSAASKLEITDARMYSLAEPVSHRRYSVVRVRTRGGITGFGEGPAIPAEQGEAHDLRQAMRTLMTTDTLALSGRGQPLSGYRDWLSAFSRAGQITAQLHDDGHLTRGLRAILAHHLIFHFNRSGLTGTDQATMAALAHDVVFQDHAHDYNGRADHGQG